MIKKFIFIIAILFIIIFTVRACSDYLFSTATVDGEYSIKNVKIYKDTPAWDLALAVKDQSTRRIKKLIQENPQLVNYQDPKYGATLLLWSIGMEKYKSAKTLLECGADPNIASKSYKSFWGESPLFLASGYSWVDNDAKKDPKYVKLLLSYGADPNWNFVGSDGPEVSSVIEPGASPLMHSIGCGIDKTKAIVESGADINHKTKSGETAAYKALLAEETPEYAYYLIVEKKAKVTEPSYRRETFGNEDPNEKFFPVTILRDWVFDLDSKEYKMKMEIVDEFARQSVNYWDTKIPKDTLEYIKKLYPDTWEEYIKKY